jgi:nucleoid-associated protein YgaU
MTRTQVRRGRVALVGCILAATMALVGTRAASGADRPEPVRTTVVRSGDTLWSIAERVVGTQGDPRPVVQQLIDVNGMSSALIVPGQRLRLPSP